MEPELDLALPPVSLGEKQHCTAGYLFADVMVMLSRALQPTANSAWAITRGLQKYLQKRNKSTEKRQRPRRIL